jgi:hypothetical protein
MLTVIKLLHALIWLVLAPASWHYPFLQQRRMTLTSNRRRVGVSQASYKNHSRPSQLNGVSKTAMVYTAAHDPRNNRAGELPFRD